MFDPTSLKRNRVFLPKRISQPVPFMGHFVFLQAFIKLESIESLTQEQKNAYEELALEIFTKYVAFKPLKARMGSCQYVGFTGGAARYISQVDNLVVLGQHICFLQSTLS